jgi:hypothetical protein
VFLEGNRLITSCLSNSPPLEEVTIKEFSWNGASWIFVTETTVDSSDLFNMSPGRLHRATGTFAVPYQHDDNSYGIRFFETNMDGNWILVQDLPIDTPLGCGQLFGNGLDYSNTDHFITTDSGFTWGDPYYSKTAINLTLDNGSWALSSQTNITDWIYTNNAIQIETIGDLYPITN